MIRKLLIKLGECIETKKTFLIYSALTMAVPCSVGLIVLFDRNGIRGIWIWIFLVFLSICGGLFWGVLMWEFFVKAYADRARARREKIQESQQ